MKDAPVVCRHRTEAHDFALVFGAIGSHAFVKASKGIYDEFSNSVTGGKEMVDKAMSLASGS